MTHHIGSSVCTSASCHLHGNPCRAFDLFFLFFALFLSVCLSYPLLFSFHFYLDPDLNLFLHVVVAKAIIPAPPPNEESGPLAENTPLTGYAPKLPDDFHHSETTEIIFQEQSSDAVPSHLFDAELDDETIGKALSSPLFIQEREEPQDRRQAYHSFEESLLPAQSFSVCHPRTGDPCTNLVR